MAVLSNRFAFVAIVVDLPLRVPSKTMSYDLSECLMCYLANGGHTYTSGYLGRVCLNCLNKTVRSKQGAQVVVDCMVRYLTEPQSRNSNAVRVFMRKGETMSNSYHDCYCDNCGKGGSSDNTFNAILCVEHNGYIIMRVAGDAERKDNKERRVQPYEKYALRPEEKEIEMCQACNIFSNEFLCEKCFPDHKAPYTCPGHQTCTKCNAKGVTLYQRVPSKKHPPTTVNTFCATCHPILNLPCWLKFTDLKTCATCGVESKGCVELKCCTIKTKKMTTSEKKSLGRCEVCVRRPQPSFHYATVSDVPYCHGCYPPEKSDTLPPPPNVELKCAGCGTKTTKVSLVNCCDSVSGNCVAGDSFVLRVPNTLQGILAAVDTLLQKARAMT